jgi:hypothetical protein
MKKNSKKFNGPQTIVKINLEPTLNQGQLKGRESAPFETELKKFAPEIKQKTLDFFLKPKTDAKTESLFDDEFTLEEFRALTREILQKSVESES